MDSSAQGWSNKYKALVLFTLSWFVVTFGQPAWIPWLGLISAICGYALFWKGLLYFRRQKDRFWLSTAWFTAVQAVQLGWMTVDEYHGLFIYGVWAFLALGLGLQFGLLSFFIRPAIRLTIFRVLAVPSAWTLLEWARLYFTAGFTWNPVGLAITSYAVPLQMASLIGIYGLSFWVMLVNVLVLQMMLVAKEKRRWAWAASMALIPYVFGSAHIVYHSHQMKIGDEQPISVILVQTGLFPKNKQQIGSSAIDAIHPMLQWTRIINLIDTHRGKPIDLIVMPEGSVPYAASQLAYSYDAAQDLLVRAWGEPYAHPELASDVQSMRYGPLKAVSNRFFCAALADRFNANVIVGLDDCNECQSEFYTSAINFAPGELVTERHDKRVLLPIAESIPYGWLDPIARQYGIEGSLTAGKQATLFSGPVPIGAVICYEETFTGLIRQTRRAGAELLVNITADGWYPNTKLPMQHFTHGRVRAIENGVPLVRACHTGVTAAVDSLGRTIAILGDAYGKPEDLAAALYVDVPRYNYHTVYSRFGDGLVLTVAAVALALFFLRPKSRR